MFLESVEEDGRSVPKFEFIRRGISGGEMTTKTDRLHVSFELPRSVADSRVTASASRRSRPLAETGRLSSTRRPESIFGNWKRCSRT
jgi:hypothetical protein